MNTRRNHRMDTDRQLAPQPGAESLAAPHNVSTISTRGRYHSVKEVERGEEVQIAVSDPQPPPSKDPPARREDEIQEDPAEPMHPSQPLPPPPRFPQEAPPKEEESTGKSESGGEGASGASMSEVPLTDARPAGTFTSKTLGTDRADANEPRETTHFPGSVRVPGSRALGERPVLGSGAPQKRARARRDVHA
jgi:hypothetical protein